MNSLFSASAQFASLSIRDLIEARNIFHYSLIDKKNVVATAVGLYRIRKDDPWPSRSSLPERRAHNPKSPRRTLFNSEIRAYSWPCIYAFVSNWEEVESLAASSPSDVIPKSLFLPDGRAVPVCVIEAKRQPWAKDLRISAKASTARNLMSPGAALLNRDGQGMERLATAGCIVRDGERYYVMTNRHALGPRGCEIFALQGNRSARVGLTAEKGIDHVDLGEVYPNFPSVRQRLTMDVGLVDLDDILAWKTEIPGIRPLGPVLDIYDNSLSLKLLGMKVVGQSAVSGYLRGEIQGLFYRHKTMGGFEYISDFLIGPESIDGKNERLRPDKEADGENECFAVHHGDSGTLLLIEHVEHKPGQRRGQTTYFPFALLWGKEEFFEDDRPTTHPFALATALSTALDRLNLDFVANLANDQPYVWGWVGHYVIGRNLALPADLLTSPALRAFIAAQEDLLAIDPDDALSNDPRVQDNPDDAPRFVPLADVPDNVWKSNVNFAMVEQEGKKTRHPGPGSRGQNDNPNHFADMDLPYGDEQQSFLALNAADPNTYLKPSVWIEYFAAQKPLYDKWAALLHSVNDGKHWGALPFRVHQLFDVMVAALKAEKSRSDGTGLALYLTAGGVLIHYMGDACQPLHTSYLSQGDPAQVVKRQRSENMKLVADGVHSGYEDEMIGYGFKQKDLIGLLKEAIARQKDEETERIEEIRSGFDASRRVIELIAATQKEIGPREIVDKWVELGGQHRTDKSAAMWDVFGPRTASCMARGTRCLAALWQAAWTEGGGDELTEASLSMSTAKLDENVIMALYNDPNVVRSVALDKYPDDPNADWSRV